MPAKKTTIEYDDTLIKFLDYITEKHNIKNYSELGFSESSFISLWSDIKTNIPLLNHSRPCGNDTIKPNNFAIFMALISDYRNINCWEDVMKHDYIFREGEEFHGSFCCCNHTITNVCVITNKITHKRVVVGNDCVRSTMIHNPAIQEKCKAIKSRATQRARKKAAERKKLELARESAIRAGAPFGGIWRGRLLKSLKSLN